MSFNKNKSNSSLESQSCSNNSSHQHELNQIQKNINNNNRIVLNQNNFLNTFNESIFEDTSSINNVLPLNTINFNIIKENRTNSISKDENIFQKEEISKDKTLKFTIIKLGRKRKNENIKSEHNKFSDDILRRKVKHLVLKSLMKFINEKIYYMYNGNIGHNIYLKQLLTINGNQNSNAEIKFNQNFLYKKLGDIFSVNIRTKYSNHDPDHNEKLIQNLKKEDNEKKGYILKNYLI